MHSCGKEWMRAIRVTKDKAQKHNTEDNNVNVLNATGCILKHG